MSFEDVGDAIVAAAGGAEPEMPPQEAPVTEVVEEALPEGVVEAPAAEGVVVEEPTLDSRFAGLEQSLSTLTESVRAIAQRPVAPGPEGSAPEAAEEGAQLDVDALLAELGDDNFTPDGAVTMDGLAQVFQGMLRQAFDARDRQAEQKSVVAYRATQMDQLVERIPALEQDPQVQDRVVNGVHSLAQQVARELGMDSSVLAQSPTLVGLVCDRLGLRSSTPVAATPSPQPVTPAVPVGRPTGGRAPAPAAAENQDEGDLIVARAQAGHRIRG